MLLTPLFLLAALFVAGVTMEMRAESELKTLLSQYKREGLAASRHASTVAFDQRTSRDHADRWRDVLLASGELEGRFHWLKEGVGDQDDHLVGAGEPWEAGPISTQYADEAAPMIALVEQLVKDPNPFWRPLLIDGHNTMLPDLQGSRSIVRILNVEFRVAVHQGDHDRAMRALRLVLDVSDAFDWRDAFVGELVRIALVEQHRSMIQESLAIGFWEDAEHLSELRQMLARPGNLDERWKTAMNADSQMVFAELFGDIDADPPQHIRTGDVGTLAPFGISPSLKLQFLKTIFYRRDVSGMGTNRYIETVIRQEKQRDESLSGPNPSLLVAVPFGIRGAFWGGFLIGEEQLVSVVTRFEFNRKITLTAVAIKQFQVKENRWPEELNELSAVGLSASQWRVEPGVPIGYRISEESNSVNLRAETDETHIISVPVEPTTKKGPWVKIWNVTIK